MGNTLPFVAPSLIDEDDDEVSCPQGSVPMVDIRKVKRLSNSKCDAACRYHFEEQRSLQSDYDVIASEVLGEGLCGKVVVAHGRRDDKRYALKMLRKEGVSGAKLMRLVNEAEIHLSLDHPSIARVQDVYESKECISMVTECCEGGQLYASLQDKGTYGGMEAAEVTRQMLGVVRHLHAQSIVHRDIKMENFLYSCKDPHAQMDKYLQDATNRFHMQTNAPQLKLVDFGFSRIWKSSNLSMMTAPCGTIDYVSPEILEGNGYTEKTDLWSIGVIVWMLLTGYPPFHGERDLIMRKIKSAEPDWSHQSRWKNVSPDAKDLVVRLLAKDPAERLDAQSALLHPWLSMHEASLPGPQSVLSMNEHVAGSKVRCAALEVLLQRKDCHEMKQLIEACFTNSHSYAHGVSVHELAGFLQQLEQSSDKPTPSAADFERRGEVYAVLLANGDHHLFYSDFIAVAANKRRMLQHELWFRCIADFAVAVCSIQPLAGHALRSAKVRKTP